MEQQHYEELIAKIRELTRRQEASRQAETAAETRRIVSSSMANLKFRDRQCRSDFRQLICQSVRADEDGKITDKDGTPLSEVIEREYASRSRWHGENNQNSQSPNKQPDEEDIDLAAISPTMSPAELDRVRLTILRNLPDSWRYANGGDR